METTQRPNEKTLLCLLGFPGAGKSVILKRLQKDLGLPRRHVGEFARSLGALSKDEIEISSKGGLLVGYDTAFLSSVMSEPLSAVLLDGFPRTLAQADLLLEQRDSQQARLAVISLSFPAGLEEKLSFQRQRDRAIHQGLAGEELKTEEERIGRKIRRALDNDLRVIEHLRSRVPDSLDLDVRKGVKPAYKVILPWVRELLGIPSP